MLLGWERWDAPERQIVRHPQGENKITTVEAAEEEHLARGSPKTDGLYLKATLQAHQKLRTLLFSSPALAVVHEKLQRLIKLLNL